jgi:hypothetical protein
VGHSALRRPDETTMHPQQGVRGCAAGTQPRPATAAGPTQAYSPGEDRMGVGVLASSGSFAVRRTWLLPVIRDEVQSSCDVQTLFVADHVRVCVWGGGEGGVRVQSGCQQVCSAATTLALPPGRPRAHSSAMSCCCVVVCCAECQPRRCSTGRQQQAAAGSSRQQQCFSISQDRRLLIGGLIVWGEAVGAHTPTSCDCWTVLQCTGLTTVDSSCSCSSCHNVT